MMSVLTMAKVSVLVVNAFTYNGEGGNPAGVVLDADQYTNEEKQEIARLAGYAETAFVSQSDVADRKLEFFTPNMQIAHCGHATVATFSYLSQLGEITSRHSSKETIDGNRNIILEGGKAYMEQKPDFFRILSDSDVEGVMASLGLSQDDLMAGHKPMVANTGVSYMIIPLAETATLKKINTDTDAITSMSEKHDLIGYYAVAMDAVDEGHDVTTRMFAPRYAIPEEAATGMAAGNLGYYLFEHMNMKVDEIVVEQGYFMDQPSKSEIIVRLNHDGDILNNIMAGGTANVGQVIEVTLD